MRVTIPRANNIKRNCRADTLTGNNRNFQRLGIRRGGSNTAETTKLLHFVVSLDTAKDIYVCVCIYISFILSRLLLFISLCNAALLLAIVNKSVY